MTGRAISAKTLAGEVPEFDPHRVVHWTLEKYGGNSYNISVYSFLASEEASEHCGERVAAATA